MGDMMKKKVRNILIILLCALPIIDLSTSIITRFYPSVLSLGIIVKGILSFFSIVYVFLLSKSQHKKSAVISFIFIGVFSLIYLLSKYSINEFKPLFNEIVYLFKYFYIFILFWGFVNIFDDWDINKETIKKVMLFNVVFYIIIFFLSIITNSGFSSYSDGHGGISAWFYAANEVGPTLTCLMPITYLYFKNKSNYIYMLLIIPNVYVLAALGTKVGIMGLLINLIIISIFYIIKNFNSLKRLLILGIILVFSIFICFNSITLNNVENQVNQKLNTETEINDEQNTESPKNEYVESNPNGGQVIEKTEEEFTENSIEQNNIQNVLDKKDNNTNKIINYITNSKYINLIFSSREDYFINTFYIFEKANLNDKLFGLGFYNRPAINNEEVSKLIEIDILDIFFHFGIVGFILYFAQFIFILYLTFIKKTTNKDTTERMISLIEILLLIGISSIAGHIFGAPAVSIYIVYYLLINIVPNADLRLKRKKIDVLALHLGYGGVESSIANQVNSLCDEYEVEIISIYKLTDNPVFKINDNVKITYLMNLKPNREEFKNALRKRNIINIFKEGVKSVIILYLKKIRMINAIKFSNASIIISTRIELAELLTKYKRDKVITITEEHVHHNNNSKYIKRLTNACKGIDYLVCVSQELTNYYRENITRTKSIHIPNSLDYTPKKLSELNNKKLISIGRLSPEKGFLDLVDVFAEMYKLDNRYCLDIIGDGVEKQKILKKIKDYNLEKNITLHGYQDKKFINEKLSESTLYLMCSHEESFGIVLIEAGSFGVPQIAFDSAQGAHELIDDNINGYLIKNRDAKAFAKIAHELINSKKKIKKFGIEARKKAEKYSFENVKIQWLKFIKSIEKEQNFSNK